MGSYMVAETETINVHASLNVTIPSVIAVNHYSNISGPFVHTIDQFILSNTVCVLTLKVSDLTTSIHDSDGVAVESV